MDEMNHIEANAATWLRTVLPQSLSAVSVVSAFTVRSAPSYPVIVVQCDDCTDHYEGKHAIRSAVLKIHAKTYVADDQNGATVSAIASEIDTLLKASTLATSLSTSSMTVYAAFLADTFRSEPDNCRCITFDVQMYYALI